MYINERIAIRDALLGGLRNPEDKSLLEQKVISEHVEKPVKELYPCGNYECPIVKY